MPPDGCPLCAARALETLDAGDWFCGACGFAFRQSAMGDLIDVVPTNHTHVGRRAVVPDRPFVDLSRVQSNPRRHAYRQDADWRTNKEP